MADHGSPRPDRYRNWFRRPVPPQPDDRLDTPGTPPPAPAWGSPPGGPRDEGNRPGRYDGSPLEADGWTDREGRVPPRPGNTPAMPPGAVRAYASGSASTPRPPVPRAWAERDRFPGRPWEPIVIDRPSARLEARPAAGHSYRPDSVADGWSTDRVTVRLASVRGYGHRANGRPREDDVVAKHHEPTGALVFAVADGVSAAEHPHIGATVACRTAVDAVIAQLDARAPGRPPVVSWDEVIRAVHWKLCRDAAALTEAAEHDVRVAERLFATTLVVGTVTPTARGLDVVLAQVGDSTAWLLWPGGQYESLLAHKSNDRPGPASSAVFALPRLPSSLVPTQLELPYPTVLLVGTDGFGDPLGDGSGPVGRLFAANLERPPAPGALAHVLDFSRETFDDDRTLLAVWHRGRLAERSG